MKLSLCILWAGICFLYFQVLNFESLSFDDPLYLSQHPAADIPLSSGSFWSTLVTSSTANLWTPLTDLSHQLLLRISSQASIHLAFNALLHGINASLVVILIRNITRSQLIALALGLLYAWHPVTVESVAWISGRKDLLCSLFILIALLLYSSKNIQGNKFKFWYLPILCIAACLSKPIGFTLPLLLVLIDYWPLSRPISLKESMIEKWKLWVISITSVIITLFAQANGTQSIEDSRSFISRICEATWALQTNVCNIIYPRDLHLSYSNPEQISITWTFVLLSIISLVTFIAYWKKQHMKPYLVGSLWFLITIGPTLGIIRAGNNLTADRYSYLPLLGIILSIAGFIMLSKKTKLKMISVHLIFVISFLCALQTYQQISHWRSQESLFANVLKHQPQNSTANLELARLAYHNHQIEKATEHLQTVLVKSDQSPRAHLLLGHINYDNKNYHAAYKHYEITANTRQQQAYIQERLAACSYGIGNTEQMKAHLIKAFKLKKPDNKTLNLEAKWKQVFPSEPLP